LLPMRGWRNNIGDELAKSVQHHFPTEIA